MPRPLRIEYANAWYHVMNRGANRQNIFIKKAHFTFFQSLLKNATEKFHVEIHAYCLMTNHYHILIRTPLPNLGKAMRYLNSNYTLHFNRSEKRDGALFRGRYKAILVSEDTYLLQVSRYIHLNPVIAKICHNASEYKWSSYQSYINTTAIKPWLNTNFVLSLLSKTDQMKYYKEFVNYGIDNEISNFYQKIHLPSILGNKDFVNQNLSNITPQYKTAYATDIRKIIQLAPIEVVLKTVANYFKVDVDSLKNSTQGKKNHARIIAIYLSRKLGQLTHQHIANKFTNLNRRSISTILRRSELLAKSNKYFKKCLDEIEASILFDVGI